MATAIELTGVGKRFTKYEDIPVLLTSAKRLRAQHRRDKIWAVRDVDFAVEQGECVGIIGRNGSGKTTLMTLMAGITAPTEGTVKVWGRVAPLISVGVGFHNELTGRENILLNATILGMERHLIEDRLDEIIAFAEVEDFIDTPVKFYSSGMAVRLGFAVAIHVDPEVLLVDEVLAVGDLGFQLKCYERMQKIRDSGTTIVVVSHNLPTVRRLCERVLLLHNGSAVYEGDPGEAISQYHGLLSLSPDEETVDQMTGLRFDPRILQIESFELVDESGAPFSEFTAGQLIRANLRVRALQDIDDFLFGIRLETASGVHISGELSSGEPMGPLSAGSQASYSVTFSARLGTGTYALSARFLRPDLHTSLADTQRQMFFVTGRSTVLGAVDMEATFVRDVATVDSFGPALGS